MVCGVNQVFPLILAAAPLPGCASKPEIRIEAVELEVLPSVMPRPSTQLAKPLPQSEFEFVPPGSAGTAIALTPAVEQKMRGRIETMQQRVRAWEAWAESR